MTVQLNTKSLNKLEEGSSKSIHYIPCKISANRKANVSQYFSQFIVDNDDQTQEVTFRGRPFNGKVVNLPDSYKGIVFVETMKPKSLKADRKFHAVRSFGSFTYWNWDKVPSKNDALSSALDWIDISKALHSPVEEDTSLESKKTNCKVEEDGSEGTNCNSSELIEEKTVKAELAGDEVSKTESENS